MKLKAIVAALAATTLATTAMAAEQTTTTTTTTTMNAQVQQQNQAFSGLKSNPAFSQQMLNTQNVMNNQLKLLQDRQNGSLAADSVYVGGSAEMYANWRLPNGVANSQTSVQMPYTNLYVASTIGEWVTGYAQLQAQLLGQYDPTTGDTTGSSDVTMPNAYFVVGNLDKAPVYFFGGKSVVNFGQFNQVTNFTPTVTRALFMQYGGNVGAGFTMDGLNLTGTLMNGDGLAMMNAGASSAQQLNAFSLNANYNFDLGNGNSAYVGAGYTNATGFENNSGKMVGAADLNAGLNVAGLGLYGEFVMTTDGVSGTNTTTSATTTNGGANAFGIANPIYANLIADTVTAFDSGATVKAWSLQADYTFALAGKDMVPYVSYSQAAQNNENNVYLAEVGTRYNIVDSIWVGGSYTYAGAKNGGDKQPNSNNFMIDGTVYF